MLPRYPTSDILKAGLLIFWARLGSLNALQNLVTAHLRCPWFQAGAASADTIGRVGAGLNTEGLRQGLAQVYAKLKRNKALPLNQGLNVAVLDGHESHASYRRHCSGCLARTVRTANGDRTQYYHRQVTLILLPGPLPNGKSLRVFLDAEPQRSGEDEVTTALRLLKRVLQACPRAFDLLLADGLYNQAPFLNYLIAHGKHALVVQKDDRRLIWQDVAGLMPLSSPQEGTYGIRSCQWWDLTDLTSWPDVNAPLRVVVSDETWAYRSQLTRQMETCTAHWVWLTTLPPCLASTARVVSFGHQRWDVENQGFNEIVNLWHADHVFKHDSNAILAFTLLAFLAYNLFHAMLNRNVKSPLRKKNATIFWAKLILAELISWLKLRCLRSGADP